MPRSALVKAFGAITPLLLTMPATAAEPDRIPSDIWNAEIHPVSDNASFGVPSQAIDPTIEFGRIFGLGGHACKIYDDTGRITIRTEGVPSPGVIAWLQKSDGGTRANVPLPLELAAALPKLPDCPMGRNHAAIQELAANVHLASETEEIAKSNKPISLHVRICFSSQGYPTPFCRDVPLTPGAAGFGFDSMAACESGKAQALDDWFKQAKDVFDFTTGWAGKDYLITDPRCVAVLQRQISG